ncbi:hypothetical protein BU23DRAFT_529053 [Bimuria novae-zelandiae CBS 107.79]|uniref:TPR-like protein n=1 Tax=Bimuria novae-zelandiae CBS 107.79 TaxID=1447943 RepID=A0A6A5VRP1_9PLEO|nr:hypothetical protein BU23DRAFT_529053 [Bimuria novae-zelandiae CBS 107.79]
MCADWSARLFNNGDTAEANQTWRNWNAFDPETRENYWPHLLIYLLDKFPHRALPFLQALTHKPCVESLDVTIIADAFEHLARTYMDKSLRNVSQRYQLQQNEPAFVPTFYHVFREHLSPHTQICSQDLLLCVARLANIEEFERLFDLFRESHACIGKNVLLHYVNIFAKAGDFRQALVCLKMAAGRAKFRPNFINGDKFRWSSALVLHRSMVNRENYHETTGIVATLVDLGLKLDILLYNVIIHNAMKAGDHLTAFKVFNALDANGLKPDVITLSTLLHGCTVMSDSAKHHDFADYCAESAIEMKDAWLAADYLYYQYVRLQFTSPRVNPLSSEDGILSESAFMDPPPMAVYIMLQLEILKAASVSPERLWSLYEKFTELVHTQHDLVLSKLARDPIIWNAFLLAFCRARNFEHASQVVQKMSSYGPSPNVYTWNIFMQGFFKTEQIQAAERVYEIMRARGIAPDQFTYEVLLRGYARAQHVSKIGEVIEHVSQEKQDDPKLLADLARVHDQRRVLYELEKARIRKEERIRLEKEAKEYRDRVRWAPPKFAPLVQPKEAPLDDKAGPRIKPIFAPGSALALQFKSTLKR